MNKLILSYIKFDGSFGMKLSKTKKLAKDMILGH